MEEINVYLDLRGVPVQLKFNEKSGFSEKNIQLEYQPLIFLMVFVPVDSCQPEID